MTQPSKMKEISSFAMTTWKKLEFNVKRNKPVLKVAKKDFEYSYSQKSCEVIHMII
jgi:hypothetical protein